MPRCARLKNNNLMYHIMVRSISEVPLFKNDSDKDMYLTIIRTAKDKFYFNVYAFCLMDNHAHFIIDPLGADISKIMHYINFKYAMYYNAKYNRVGHLFQDRFKSKIIYSYKYLFNLSLYIHANPNDIPQYKNKTHLYKYSSLIDYIKRIDRFKVLTISYLLKNLFLYYNLRASDYARICSKINSKDEIACKSEDTQELLIEEKNEYRRERYILLRNQTPKYIINHVAHYLNVNFCDIHIKGQRKYIKFRSLCCFLLNCFCNIPQRDICLIFGNITQASISRLSAKGSSYMKEDPWLLQSLLI